MSSQLNGRLSFHLTPARRFFFKKAILAEFQELFKDPVIASDGFTYERSAIEDWISRKRTSPMTNEPLIHTLLTPNLAFRSMIHDMQEDGVALPL